MLRPLQVARNTWGKGRKEAFKELFGRASSRRRRRKPRRSQGGDLRSGGASVLVQKKLHEGTLGGRPGKSGRELSPEERNKLKNQSDGCQKAEVSAITKERGCNNSRKPTHKKRR